MSGQHSERALGGALAAVAVIPVAMVLVPVRSVLGSQNVAMILLLLVVVAAILGGRASGLSASLAAAMSFNFFHTAPYLTLRIRDGRDIVTVAILAASGGVVGEVAERVRRRWMALLDSEDSLRALEGLVGLVPSGASHDVVMAAANDVLRRQGPFSCSFTSEPGAEGQPVLARCGRIEVVPGRIYRTGHVPLPAAGVAVPVRVRGRTVGALVVAPENDRGTTAIQRRLVVTVADLVGSAIAARGN
jgi:hypothetical protein